MDKDKFNLKYLIAGEGLKDWYKALGNGWRIGIIALVAFLLILGLSSIFRRPTQSIVAKRGSHVEVTQINKTSRFFIPFIEGGVEQRSNSDLATFIRGGLRIEF